MTPAPEKRIPVAQLSMDELYMFSYDGKEKRIIKSVIERYQTDESNRFSIHLYYDVQSKNELGNCVSFYQGFSTKYDVLENYTLENSRHPIEQIWLSCISGLSQNRIQVGFLAGLLNATMLPAVRKVVLSPSIISDEELMELNATMLPAVRKVVLSPSIISDEELMERLVFTKKDLQTIRKLSFFIIDEFIG